MGLFQKLFQRKKNKKQAQTEEIRRPLPELSEENYRNPEARAAFLRSSCEMIKEARRQSLEVRKEYEVVTSYLADIQRLDMIAPEGKTEIEECARRIVNLNAERMKMQKTPAKITVAQRNALEPYEETMPDEIRKMEETEKRQELINSDLRHLESEKEALNYEMEDLTDKNELERKLLTVICVFVALLLGLLFFLQEYGKKDVQVPFLFTVAFGLLAAGYFFYSYRRNSYDIKMAEKKVNRAILLLNKVKIKYVNCTNLLDYSYEKFHVNNAKELKFHWQEYMRIVEEEKRFQKAVDLIEFYNSELVKELKKLGVQDAGIWIYQPEALLDPKEMVEVRHRLNVRRQKLRKQVDYNAGQEEMAMRSVRTLVSACPEYEREVRDYLKRNEIEL